jgi:hypothetical protein
MTDKDFTDGEFKGQVLSDLNFIKESLAKKVDREEFSPVKSIVYGLVGVIMLAVIGAMTSLVIKAADFILR